MATTSEARYAQGLEAEQPKHLSNWNMRITMYTSQLAQQQKNLGAAILTEGLGQPAS